MYDFITAYIGIAVHVVLFVSWKVIRRTRWLFTNERNILTEKAEIDVLEEIWEDERPKNIWQKIWNWIACGG